MNKWKIQVNRIRKNYSELTKKEKLFIIGIWQDLEHCIKLNDEDSKKLDVLYKTIITNN